MLTVAPSGSTKLLLRCDTPARFCTHSMVNGRVAAELAEENAVSRAGVMAWMCRNGERRARKNTNAGMKTKACRVSATTTEAKNQASGSMASRPVRVTVAAIRANTPSGVKRITSMVIFITT